MFLIVIAAVILLYGFVVVIGAPYVPTLTQQQADALDLLALKKGQTVLDLGSGDGRFLRAAALSGYKAVGIEANPLLVLIAYAVCWRQRRNVTIIWGNMWQKQWPATDGIYVFLHSRFMQKLDNKVIQQYHGKNIKLVSYAFKIPSKKIVKKHSGMYLYFY
ncbi:hypothetical protein H6795_00335 [Candidatus Nomurabacteria bacterium]|nr:hypothetical protein [Candidatus Nomurabacteria bacterium]